MKVVINLNPSLLPLNTTVRYTKSYGHPDMIDCFGLTTEFLGTKSNFCHVDFFSPVTGFGAVKNYYLDVDMNFLASVQPTDDYTNDQKMNWLVGDINDGSLPSRPLWLDGSYLRCGTNVFGNQPVLIKTDDFGNPLISTYNTKYPNRNYNEDINFYHVMGMPKSMIGQVTQETHPYWIQRCSQAKWVNNTDVIDWYPKGSVNWVIWSYEDWLTNTKTTDMLLATICLK